MRPTMKESTDFLAFVFVMLAVIVEPKTWQVWTIGAVGMVYLVITHRPR